MRAEGPGALKGGHGERLRRRKWPQQALSSAQGKQVAMAPPRANLLHSVGGGSSDGSQAGSCGETHAAPFGGSMRARLTWLGLGLGLGLGVGVWGRGRVNACATHREVLVLIAAGHPRGPSELALDAVRDAPCAKVRKACAGDRHGRATEARPPIGRQRGEHVDRLHVVVREDEAAARVVHPVESDFERHSLAHLHNARVRVRVRARVRVCQP